MYKTKRKIYDEYNSGNTSIQEIKYVYLMCVRVDRGKFNKLSLY